MFRAYQRVSRQFGIHDPVLVTTFPCVVDVIKLIPAAATIYYCVDEWLDYPGLDTVAWRTMEKELLDHVDGFAATSINLQKKSLPHHASLLLPHGVDFQHFNSALADPLPIAQMERIPRPIVGFFGLISEWIDIDLIAVLARTFPEVSFVFLGGAEVKLDRLAECPNVYLLGSVPYADLPQYARYFDVGLIPFVTNTLTKAVNPLKLLEYYALGLPVLATRLPELQLAGGAIWLASTPEEFCENLRQMLEGKRLRPAEDSLEVARNNTWEQRVEQLGSFIASVEN